MGSWEPQSSPRGPPKTHIHLNDVAPPLPPRALHALEGPFPRLLSLQDIVMGCFLKWMAAGTPP